MTEDMYVGISVKANDKEKLIHNPKYRRFYWENLWFWYYALKHLVFQSVETAWPKIVLKMDGFELNRCQTQY